MILGMQAYSLAEIQEALAHNHRFVAEDFAAIAGAQFYAHPPQVWSPAENLAHLCKTVRAATLAFRVPARLSGLIWGSAESSRSYAELVTSYKAVLDGGVVSPAAYVAELDEVPQDEAAAKQDLLQRWQQAAGKLEAALANWHDEDLDKAKVPHPVLGKLTLRELLFFTLYHNLHHVNDVRRLLGQPEVEVL